MPEQIVLIALIIAIIFSTVHLTAPKLYGFSERYKKAVISFSGGIAAAYVFFDLLPTIQKAGGHLNLLLRNYLGQTSISEVAVFGVAFIGFLVFFILEHAAVRSRRRAAADVGKHVDSVAAPKGVFVIHFSILALISLLIAYNLRFEVRASLLGALLFSIALILHFFGTDRTMEIHYRSMFERYGRYISV